jgi:hypothetical protein
VALTPWPKGRSGNPGGRPKRKPLTELLVAELEACVHGTDTTRMQEIIQRLVQMAAAGDLGAIKHIWAYVEGLPTQKVDIRGEVERLAEQYGRDPDELYERTLRVIEGMKR